MTMQPVALVFLAVAAVLADRPHSGPARLRRLTAVGRSDRHRPPPAWRSAALCAVAAGLIAVAVAGWLAGPPAVVAGALLPRLRRLFAGRRPGGDPGDLDLSARWDLLASCLRAGLPVPTAIRAVATDLPGVAGAALRSCADQLGFGADPARAWQQAMDQPAIAPLARAARRSSRSGTAIADVAAALAQETRAAAADLAEARAQRAGVLITGPLGLCFLPAFICLGIVPVVLGLAGRLTAT